MLRRPSLLHRNLLHRLLRLRPRHKDHRSKLRHCTEPSPPSLHNPAPTLKAHPKLTLPPKQVRCALPTPLPGTTTTITACSASPTCTSVITSTAPFGCTITVPARTKTELIDCKGCTLSTTTVINRLFGLGPECVGGRKTVQGGTGVARATACLAEE
jgi:hypothetical protein